jgi:hypothetical protein
MRERNVDVKMRVVRRLVLTLPLGLIAFTLGGCNQTDQQSRARAGHKTQPNTADLSDSLANVHRIESDYEPVDTPAALARRVDAVVTGTIVAVSPGQSYAPTRESETEIATSVLEVKVGRVLAGDAGVVAKGSVNVEVAHPAVVDTGEERGALVPFDHAAFAATVPRSSGIFFLDDRTEEPYWDTILDEGAGRPAGARITRPVTQGFLIEDGRGGLVA